MKIVFLGLASCFTPGMLYLENCLTEELQYEGNEVVFISNCDYFDDGKLVHGKAGIETLDNGIKLYRLQYLNIMGKKISEKVRVTKGVYSILLQEKPDVIFCQGIQFKAVLDVIKYKKTHKEVHIMADNHASYKNSGSSWISLKILHGLYYKYLYKRIEPYLEKYYYVGSEEKEFAINIYKARKEIMELLPLGGKLLDEDEYNKNRDSKRASLEVDKDDVLIIHSGKMSPEKRTDVLLRAFTNYRKCNVKLIIAGDIEEKYKKEIMPLIEKDKRIKYLGWISGEELISYLCAADVYCQPGGVSATLQVAICNRCAIISYPHKTYIEDYDNGNFIWAESENDIIHALSELAENPEILDELKRTSLKMSMEMLDYKVIANKVTF